MSSYTLISSRDPFTCATTTDLYQLATAYRKRGHEVTLFLVENGVLAARAGVACPALADALSAGVVVLAETFSLRQRAIPQEALQPGVAAAELERVVDDLARNVKTVWH